MDDLKSIIEYHEQVLRSLENQMGQLFEGREETKQQMKRDREQADLSMKQFNGRMDRLEAYMARAFRLGVAAARRERVRRQQEERRRHEEDQWLGEQDRRLEKQIAESRAEWEKSRAEWEKRMTGAEQQRARDLAASDERMTRFETNLDRFLKGLQGSNGKGGPLPSEA